MSTANEMPVPHSVSSTLDCNAIMPPFYGKAELQKYFAAVNKITEPAFPAILICFKAIFSLLAVSCKQSKMKTSTVCVAVAVEMSLFHCNYPGKYFN